MKKVVYLDWNVFKGLQNPNTEQFEILSNKLCNQRENIVIPFSKAHLDDLNKDYEKNRDWIDKDLQFLSEYSRNIVIERFFGHEEFNVREQNPTPFFHEIRKNEEEEQSIQSIGEHINNDIGNKFDEIFGDSLKALIPNKKQLSDSESGQHLEGILENFLETGKFSSLITDISNLEEKFQNNPEQFNQIQKAIKSDTKLDSNISNWKPTIEKLDEYLPNTKFGKSFSECVIEDVCRYYKKPVFFDLYVTCYNQLGIYGFRTEKFDHKNRFGNMIQDSFHSYYGFVSDLFIINEKNCFFKSEVLFDAFKTKSQLIKMFNIDDLEQFSNQLDKALE